MVLVRLPALGVERRIDLFMVMEILHSREDRGRIMNIEINYSEYMRAIIKSFTIQMDSIDTLSLNEDKVIEISSDKETKEALKKVIETITKSTKEVLPPIRLQYKIPNASAKQPFISKLTVVNPKISSNDELIIEQIDGLDDIGGDIIWNVDTQELIGTPQNAGDFILTVRGVLKLAKGYSRRVKSYMRFMVIPDPRSLWKDIQPDLTKPYPKPNEASSYLISKDKSRLIYTSKRGRSHAHIGTFRDDDGKIKTDMDSGWSVLAVADGAGSCSLSRRGSEIVVDESVNILLKYLSGKNGQMLESSYLKNREESSSKLRDKINRGVQGTIISAIHHAMVEVHKESKKIQVPLKEFSTTLLLVGHKHTPKGHLIISFWVGDGALAIYKKGDEVRLLGEPDSGEFAGQTRFLDSNIFKSSERLSKRIHISLVEDFTSLILATDGVSDPFFESDDALKETKVWDDFWNRISDKLKDDDLGLNTAKLLGWLDFWSKGNHDDRSIALLLPSKEIIEEIGDEDESIGDDNGTGEGS
jgi:serine/threonine protein phosphatase PrpC